MVKHYLLVAFVLLGACSKKSSNATSTISSAGGTVKTSDGTQVTIGANALASPTAITIGDEPNTVAFDGSVLVSRVYRFGPEGTQFAQPVTVTLAFDPSKMPAGATDACLVINTAPVGSTNFVALATTLVDATHLSAPTMHFSDFVASCKIPDNNNPDQAMSSENDLGVNADLTGAVTADLTGVAPADMTSVAPADMTGAATDLVSTADLIGSDLTDACPRTYSSMTCGFSATCGYTYTLNCQQTICYCSGGNMNKTCPKAAPDTGMTHCPGQAAVDTIWTSCCNFPQ